MQPRLTRSHTDITIAGVCGGLAEYFGIDSVIVRLIFVLMTLMSGLGLPMYIALWILMPKKTRQTVETASSPTTASPANQHPAPRRGEPASPHPTSGPYLYNPQTGQPFQRSMPATGETIKLDPTTDSEPFQSQQGDLNAIHHPPHRQEHPGPTTSYPHHQTPPQAVEWRRRSWRNLGMIFVGLGGLMLLSQLGIKLSLIVPPLLIVGGILLLRRGS